MPYWCRECIKFVRGPLATCASCGREHNDHMGRALEEPIPFRRRRRRR